MRLINARTLRLEEFILQIPKYAILSHTWEAEEVTFQHFNAAPAERMKGYQKIKGAAMQALRDGLAYVWVDTCCIDKTSSTELSEAINSMFNWYRDASACYAYLSDVTSHADSLADIRNDRELTEKELEEVLLSPFATSRWFTRGWTLQEFIAPRDVKFYNCDWQYFGAKQQLSAVLAEITGVDEDVLVNRVDVAAVCTARKMSWAAARQTTRIEDTAYCLLGIFGINMPLIYGEGGRAFIRLQEEIIRVTNDQSLFAWNAADANDGSLFAPGPHCFANACRIVRWERLSGAEPWDLTNYGLRIRLPLVGSGEPKDSPVAVLACRYEDDFTGPIGLRLATTDEPNVFEPSISQRLLIIDSARASAAEMNSLFVLHSKLRAGLPRIVATSPENMKCWVRLTQPVEWPAFEAKAAYPPRCWNKSTMTMWVRRGNKIKGALHLLSGDGKEVVLAFGYERSGTRIGRSFWSSEWIRIVKYEEGRALEQMCDEAGVLSREDIWTSATYSHGAEWMVSAKIQAEVVMSERIYVVDVKVS